MRVALIHDVFFDASGADRLRAALSEARERDAELAVLPEIPCNPWSPATREARDDDAEPPGGPRATLQGAAAKEAGMALVGGAIVRDPDGRRHNTALVFAATGELVGRYCKVHLPHEPGFWEADHYEPGGEPPRAIDGLPMRLGLQICSDANRPSGTQQLAAQGVALIVVPRATEGATWERWKLALRANALTGACYVLSVNRPGPEQGVALGGPSFAADPDGDVLVESEQRLCVVDLDPETVARARRGYPGYLTHGAALYREGWGRLVE